MSLPKGYKRLEYIQSSGTQYIDTGITSIYIMVADLQFVNTGNRGLMGQNAKQGYYFGVTADGYYELGGGVVSSYSGLTRRTINVVGTESDISLTAGNETITRAKTETSNDNFKLFSHLGNNPSSAKLYSCQIYDNGTQVRDFIPCQNASGVVGLWDSVHSAFYGNFGTGTFTAGPVVPETVDESEITELEYIESSGTQYVNSGFAPNQNTRVVFNGYNDSTLSGWTYGTWESATVNQFAGSCNESYAVRYGTTNATLSANVPVGPVHFDQNQNSYNVNGTTGTFAEQTFACQYSIYLFAINAAGTVSSGKFTGKIYSCQIYDNGLLERDYIPAMLSNGEVGLYDKANSEFYRNAGSGAFTSGKPVGTADITPTMTSNTAPTGYVASQSSAHGGLNAWYAFDGVDSTVNNPSPVWHSTAGMPQWIMLQFPEAVKATFFSIKNRGDVDSTYKQYGPKAFELQGSHHGTDFAPLGAYTSDGALGATGLYRVQNPGKYQYYRVYVTEAGYVYNNQQYAVVDQIRFYEPLILTPDAPANFRVESETDTLVTLAWDASEDVLGYRLYRAGKLLAETTELSLSVAVEPFAGAVFTLTAYNENGEGAAAELTYYNVPKNPMLYLITDRTQADVTERNPKGYYATSDLNRVGYAMDYLANIIRGYGYTLEVHTKTDWTDEDWKLTGEMVKYLQSLNNLKGVFSTLVELPEIMEKINYADANNIEQMLLTIDQTVARVVAGFTRTNAFALRSGAKGLPVSQSERGRNWGQLDAMNTTWANWQLATWYLLLYGNLKVEGVVE